MISRISWKLRVAILCSLVFIFVVGGIVSSFYRAYLQEERQLVNQQIQISLLLADNSSSEQIELLLENLEQSPLIQSQRILDPQRAWLELTEKVNVETSLIPSYEGLESFPTTIVVSLFPLSQRQWETLFDTLTNHERVEEVLYSVELIERLLWLDRGKQMALIMMITQVVLSFILMALLIHRQMEQHKNEYKLWNQLGGTRFEIQNFILKETLSIYGFACIVAIVFLKLLSSLNYVIFESTWFELSMGGIVIVFSSMFLSFGLSRWVCIKNQID